MTDVIDIKRRFLDSIKLGTGESYLILKDYPNLDFSGLIIKGASKNFAYDPQSEGSRATYISGLINKSKQKDRIINAILTRLKSKKNDYYGLEQMCDLAVQFYKEGNYEAKTALYNRFEKNNLQGYQFCGQDQLMEVDGLSGLMKVAETIGKKIIEENDWEDSWRVDDFQRKNKHITVYTELEKSGKQNKYIEAYYKSICENKSNLSRSRKPIKFSYDLFKSKIYENKFRVFSQKEQMT